MIDTPMEPLECGPSAEVLGLMRYENQEMVDAFQLDLEIRLRSLNIS